MKSIKALSLLLAAVFVLASCKKESSPQSIIHVTVLAAANHAPVSGQELKLLSDNGSIVSTQKSGSDGKLSFTVTKGTTSYLYVYYKSPEEATAAYITIGKFMTQKEIDVYARQTPTPKVDDDKFADIDGDGIVGPYDKVVPVAAVQAEVDATYTIK